MWLMAGLPDLAADENDGGVLGKKLGRLRVTKVAGGRWKFTFEGIDIGGSYLVFYDPYVKDFENGKDSFYADFDEDSPEWKARRRK